MNIEKQAMQFEENKMEQTSTTLYTFHFCHQKSILQR